MSKGEAESTVEMLESFKQEIKTELMGSDSSDPSVRYFVDQLVNEFPLPQLRRLQAKLFRHSPPIVGCLLWGVFSKFNFWCIQHNILYPTIQMFVETILEGKILIEEFQKTKVEIPETVIQALRERDRWIGQSQKI